MIATGISRVQRARPAGAGMVVAVAATISLLPGRRPLCRSRTASTTRFDYRIAIFFAALTRLPVPKHAASRQAVNSSGAGGTFVNGPCRSARRARCAWTRPAWSARTGRSGRTGSRKREVQRGPRVMQGGLGRGPGGGAGFIGEDDAAWPG